MQSDAENEACKVGIRLATDFTKTVLLTPVQKMLLENFLANSFVEGVKYSARVVRSKLDGR